MVKEYESERVQGFQEAIELIKKIQDKPTTPITITLESSGKQGVLEIESFLKVLEILRSVNYLEQNINEKKQKVKAEIKKERKQYDPITLFRKEPEKVDAYKCMGGMILQLSYNKKTNLIQAKLREDLSREGESYFEQFLGLLQTWTVLKELEIKPLVRKGEEVGSRAVFGITELKKLTSLEGKLLGEITLYQNMQKSLSELVKGIEKNRKLNPQRFLDEIQFYTNFGGLDLKKLEKQTKLAYFLREAYGIVEAENNVTIDMVKSNLKSRAIAANRHALMFLCRNKFSWLSSSTIGIVFSNYGARPKNHATVLMACKLFNTRVKGIKVKDYPNEGYSAKDLLYDAENRYLAYLRKDKEKYKNKTIENIFKFKPK